MGRNKAEIPWGGGTLLSHAVEQMRQVARKVSIVGGEQESIGLETVRDELPGCGPLAGIHAALRSTSTEWNLVVAVDMPLVNTKILSFIAGKAMDDEAFAAAVPKIAGTLQPLCGMYSRSFLAEIDRALKDRQLSIHRLLEQVKTRIIEENEFVNGGFVPEMFLNVNTPEDLERARLIAKNLNVE